MYHDIDVSVIVPVYNSEKYLRKCIESVLEQTMSSWELILVDDGSRDKSFEICQEYAKKHNKISAVHQENSGSSVTRNLGLRMASGKYIAFVDADDWIDTRMLEVLVQKAEQTNIKW